VTAYDDERVITLLRESVPAVPDSPARVDSVRRLAARQRSFAGMQAIGAVATVVLVIAAVAALGRPASTVTPVKPVADPVRTMTAAFLDAKSVRFELSSEMRRKQHGTLGPWRTSGSARGNGDYEYTGYGLTPFAMVESETKPGSARVVDGVTYRSPDSDEVLPPGKRWVRSARPSKNTPRSIAQQLASDPDSFEDVSYVRETSVRGTPVAEYTATSKESYDAGSTVTRYTFALDSDGRPRRISLTQDIPAGAGKTGTWSVSIELFDYDAPVAIAAPPAAEVATEAEAQAAKGQTLNELSGCLQGATSQGGLDDCLRPYEQARDTQCDGVFEGVHDWSYHCADGSEGETGDTTPAGEELTATAGPPGG
jgi:hypothetical protein